jgi:ABC-type transport system involved in cytochrome bd biosynthesis fused ATPase/permease subunit
MSTTYMVGRSVPGVDPTDAKFSTPYKMKVTVFVCAQSQLQAFVSKVTSSPIIERLIADIENLTSDYWRA